ncbi:MAG: glycosyltransferase family 4 protein [bacterium]
MKDVSLLVISTYGVGLKVWKDGGLYDREIGYYKKLGKYIDGFGIMVYDKTNEKPFDGGYDYYYNRYKIPNIIFSFIWPFLNFKAIKKYNIIRTNQFSGAWVGLLIKLLHKEKVFVMRGGYAWHANKKGFIAWLIDASMSICLKFADLVFFVSPEDRDDYLKKYGQGFIAKCRILPNSIDTDLFKPNNNPSGDGKIHIALVGRLVEMKNFQSALMAIANLKEELKSQVCVDIVGLGDFADNLVGIAKEKKLNYKFWGPLANNEIAKILSNSDIYLLPQLFASGMSKGILEAMACGNVVIVSDIEAHKTTVEDKVDGFLCRTDIKSIQEKLDYVIERLSFEEIKNLRKKAVEKVESLFSMEKTAEKEFQYLKSKSK